MWHVSLLNSVARSGAQDHPCWTDLVENNFVSSFISKNLAGFRKFFPNNAHAAFSNTFKCVFHIVSVSS